MNNLTLTLIAVILIVSNQKGRCHMQTVKYYNDKGILKHEFQTRQGKDLDKLKKSPIYYFLSLDKLKEVKT